MKFIDEVNIVAHSGNGGAGCVSFRREALIPRGGPDGGDGGKGGDVIFKSSPRINSLLDLRFKRKYYAGHGGNGGGNHKSGLAGEDLVLKVPPGTLVRNRETGEVLADLSGEESFLLIKGGRGGKGNSFFKSSVNQAPQKAQPGERGENTELSLELKLIADVGIIGLPNAGKSTLISRISAAKPKVADYPFTTLVPNLGVVRVDAERSFVVADTPGLIPGASEGVGLGIKFLKHIERTSVYIHMIDGSEMSGKDPLEAYYEIRKELTEYDKTKNHHSDYKDLDSREEVVVLNKIDTLTEERQKEIVKSFKDKAISVICASAVTGANIPVLLKAVSDIVFKKDEEQEGFEV